MAIPVTPPPVGPLTTLIVPGAPGRARARRLVGVSAGCLGLTSTDGLRVPPHRRTAVRVGSNVVAVVAGGSGHGQPELGGQVGGVQGGGCVGDGLVDDSLADPWNVHIGVDGDVQVQLGLVGITGQVGVPERTPG